MELKHPDALPSRPGPAEFFTGAVRLFLLNAPPPPARAESVLVNFEPGARTHWHTHPLGQTLIVTTGSGFVQKWGESVQTIGPGDVVWIAPGEKHWHGAAPGAAMSHIAIHEVQDGNGAAWLEPVSGEQYPA